MSYSDKLRDHRWISLRDRIKQRDGHKCVVCESSTKLQVHHLIYSKGEPWDIPESCLETLCDNCHAIRTEYDSMMTAQLRLKPSREVLTRQVVSDFLEAMREERVHA